MIPVFTLPFVVETLNRREDEHHKQGLKPSGIVGSLVSLFPFILDGYLLLNKFFIDSPLLIMIIIIGSKYTVRNK
ncbi:MAG TPA: hypothetical protein DEF48_23300 [Nostoc sp. UBA8866]|nr:hypothetical protein [Nostoc sp. UBA8866]